MIPVAGTLLEPLLQHSRLRYRQHGRRLIAFLPSITFCCSLNLAVPSFCAAFSAFMRAQASFYLQRASARPARAPACARLCLLQATAACLHFHQGFISTATLTGRKT